MIENEAQQFDNWYKEQSQLNLPYVNRTELINYCCLDVEILRKGSLAFMSNFLEITGVNPLLQSFTLAQAVMLAYRKKFIMDNTLGVIPSNLYHHANKNQSRIGLKWLIYEARQISSSVTTTKPICHEIKLATTNLYVGGFCKSSNTIYEFLGCYWHGCKKCFVARKYETYGSDSFDTKYDQTVVRLSFIASLGYNIKKIWKCEFKKFLAENPDISASLENDPEIRYGCLDPRDALYGGRTETFQLYYKAQPGEKIHYFDFTSLYPYVNKYGKNPIHHLKVFRREQCVNLNISNIDGLIKCAILPPQTLLIHVLPAKINDKLLFTLCRTCAQQTNVTSPCSHNDENDRLLVGTWVIDEVKLAQKYDYKIIEIFEVWQYDVSQYDRNTKSGGVFTDYMNCFLKLKQEASDWPANVSTPSEKENFIKEFFQHEGIQLDPKVIRNNPSQRGCSKLALNALWGKFGQRNDRSMTSIVHTAAELYDLISSPGIEITDVLPVENVLWIKWKHYDSKSAPPLKHVSLSIGPFTTANARIKLYKELAKVQGKLLYCDTDSIIFVEDDNNKGVLETGNFIGDLTNEISCYGKNSYITEFVSTGPKSYGYVVFNPDTGKYHETAKCKGITLNIESKKLMNFCSLKSIVTDVDDEGFRVVTNAKKIKRRKVLQVVSQPEFKKFGFTYTKRVCLDEFKTIPFGYLD